MSGGPPGGFVASVHRSESHQRIVLPSGSEYHPAGMPFMEGGGAAARGGSLLSLQGWSSGSPYMNPTVRATTEAARRPRHLAKPPGSGTVERPDDQEVAVQEFESMVVLVVLGTTLWVCADSRAIRARTGVKVNGSGAFAWGVAMLAFWIYAFPYYLTKRSAANRRPSVPSRVASSTEATKVGWHPDPLGRHHLRFWDGHRWTDDVA